MTLALFNALFFSLATGILVSAIGRDSQQVMGGTLGLVILFAGVLPVLVKAGLAMGVPPGWECLAWISPYYAFGKALEPMYLWQPARYWCALLALGLIDEYNITVHPVILGNGKPLLRDVNVRRSLKLVNTKTYHSGAVGLSYQSVKV